MDTWEIFFLFFGQIALKQNNLKVAKWNNIKPDFNEIHKHSQSDQIPE